MAILTLTVWFFVFRHVLLEEMLYVVFLSGASVDPSIHFFIFLKTSDNHKQNYDRNEEH